VLTGPDASGLASHLSAHTWQDLLAAGEAGGPGRDFATWRDSPALWLYSSGTTGTPKAVMHRHESIRLVAEAFGQQVLRITPDDVCFSVAKLFFAYGIGNSMFFPLSVGGVTVLDPARPTPTSVARRLAADRPTLFFGVPTFYASLLASEVDAEVFTSVRQGVSAGEPLPASIYRRMLHRFGVEVLDGIGSSEALHIFLSNRPGQVRPGSSGTPVPGYDVELRDDEGRPVPVGQSGTLFVRGGSLATGYWCRTEVSRRAFQGEWLRTGDTYVRNDDGTYASLGRRDDMLKAGGIWVSPAEVEERILAHDSVAEVVVVGVPDADGLDKPVACVVAAEGRQVVESELIDFCREGLSAFKRPRHVVRLDELPKTATGKVQRFALREMVIQRLAATGSS
jgi:benzoate-CoA ligase